MEQAEKIMPTHISAGAGVVLNEGGEVLRVRTPRSGWVFPGGQVEVGENVIDAVRREILEETGVTAEVGEVFCISSNTQTHPGHSGVKVVPTKLMLDFICRAVGGTPRPSEENPESRFVPRDKVLELVQSPNIIQRYQAFLDYAGRPAYLEYVTRPVFELKLKRLI